MMITRETLETALDTGKLYMHMRNGGRWKARRNGVTKTWKTRPDDFSIPVKCGLRSCTRLERDALAMHGEWFTIEP